MKEGWIGCQFEDVLNIISGKNQKMVTSNNGRYPIYGSGGIIGRAMKYLCEPGTTIIGRKGTINSPIYVNQRFWNVDTAFGLSPFEILEDKLLYYYTVLFNFHELDKSTTIPSLAKRDLLKITIPLPPLPEQRAIVSKIEELFSDLDKGIADLKKAQEQLKVYRQAVWKKAFEGELTKEWREKQVNLISSMNLDEELPNKPHLPLSWKWLKSGDLFSFVTSGSRGWAKYYSTKGAIFVRITNLNFNSLELDLSEDKIQYVTPPVGTEGSRTKIQEGDFLFSITGYLGMFAIAPHLEDAYVNQHVSLCRPKDGFSKRYVGYWIISQTGGILHLNKNQKGAVKAGLNLDDLKSFPVPIPSLSEQHQIVQEIESRLSVCDKVEQSISESLEKAQALRQSILKKAFEGTLLSKQEIEKCKQEKDWEPASVLLERIKKSKS